MNTEELEKLKEFYQPKNLNARDAGLLNSLTNNSLRSVELTISNLHQILSDLKMYKECLIDTINVETEISDIISTYTNDAPSQSHTLPGIETSPPLYDLHAIQADNARYEELKSVSDKVSDQKTIYFKLLKEDYKELSANFKKVIYFDATISQFISTLENV